MDVAGNRFPGRTVVLVTGGDPPDPSLPLEVPDGARVIAADSGVDAALVLGLVVDEAVGDFDSVSKAGLAAVTDRGASLQPHEPDKDATDLELAMAAALGHRPDRIIVLGGLGGRVDHEVANLSLLSGNCLAGIDVAMRSGRQTVSVVRPGRRTVISGTPRDLVSLIPVHGAAGGVTTDGLRWPLIDADLTLGTTRGVSNELLGQDAWVSCTDGVLLAAQPGVAAPFVRPRAPMFLPRDGSPR